MPDSVRQTLPVMKFGGAMYSEDPGLRMVILNNQVFHEGDTPAPGVKVLRIQRRSALIGYRGYSQEIK